MILIKLQLENFQGIKTAIFDFGGQSASIYGDNATGKTTVFNAITWLLFDKASTGAKNFTPKTKGPDGDLHYLDHAVDATFKMDNGRIVTLRKVFHENYKKKRGSVMEEFSGHSIEFFIDGVPAKEREYTDALMSFCGGAEIMKMLTMPHYFAEGMAWDARRKILLEICGDVTDEDVIRSAEELEGLPGFLLMPGTTNQHYTVEEYKKIAAAQKADINKQLLNIPGRIDEAKRAMPEIDFNVDDIKRGAAKLADDRKCLFEQKTAILAGDTGITEIRKKISDANARLAEARTAHITATAAANEGVYAAIAEIRRQLSEANSTLSDTKAEIENRRRNVERMNSLREELLKEYEEVQNEVWDENQEVCPFCRRGLPDEHVAKMREDFHVRKSNRLQGINEQGQKKASKETINAELKEIDTLHEQEDAAKCTAGDLGKQLDALQSQIKQAVPFEQTDEYSSIIREIAILRAEEEKAGSSTNKIADTIGEQIQAIDKQIEAFQTKILQAEQAKAQQKRIEELAASEKTLSAQYEELEKGIYLCDQFTKAKVNMLTDRINSKFVNVRFRLFIEQQNGGVKDDCEVMIPADGGKMIPFTFANNAARINAGLEIIDVLSKHWGLSMPVFIDNAESVTRLIQMDTQVIRLVVSAADAELRLELDSRKEGAA